MQERDYKYRFTMEQEAEITRRYIARESTGKLAEEYSCSQSTIREVAKRNGAPAYPKGNKYREFSPEEIAEMGRRWEAGESQYAIAQHFQCAQVIVSRVLRTAGYELHTRLMRGERSNFWKGGRTKHPSGYWQVLIPRDHKFASMRNRMGYVLEHRLVMAEQLGRPLLRTETVHHKDGNRLNNAPDNLQLRQGRHGHGTVYCCADCGSRNIIPCAIDD